MLSCLYLEMCCKESFSGVSSLCTSSSQHGIVAVHCATLFMRQSSRELEEAELYWKGGISACTVPPVTLDLSLARCTDLHGAAQLQKTMGGKVSLAVLLLSLHQRMRVREFYWRDRNAPTTLMPLYSFCEGPASEMFSQVIFTC